MGVTLAEMIRAARKKKGMSQLKLGLSVGVTDQAISDIETGRTRQVQSDTLEGLSAALDIPIETLAAAMTSGEVATIFTTNFDALISAALLAKLQETAAREHQSLEEFLEDVIDDYAPKPKTRALRQAALPEGERERHEAEVERKTRRKGK